MSMYTKFGLIVEKCNIQMGYNEPMGLLGKRTTCPFYQKNFFI
jgi:hypothetical protein